MKLETAICINLKSRPDRKKQIIYQSKKWKFDIEFFNAEINKQSPVTGCWDSHLSVISDAKNKNNDYVWIIEDDTIFDKCPTVIPDPPSDWGMIYMGGTIVRAEPFSDYYERVVSVLSTHSYIIRKNLYDSIPIQFQGEPIDVWLSKHIQPNFPCYILKDPISCQSDGYSDIESRFTKDPRVRKDPEYEYIANTITEAGDIQLILKDAELPKISIIVPVRKDTKFINVILHNYHNTEYPSDLVEWIIIDSSDNNDLHHLLPEDIIYLQLPGSHSISSKRNYGCSRASGSIILHVDDDDFYNKYHALSRVRGILSNDIECIGCTIIPCMDSENYTGYLRGNTYETLMEGSMAYTKKFWEEQQFDPMCERGEGLLFLKNRDKESIRQIPWIFVLDATLTHSTSITKGSRNNSEGTMEIYSGLSEDAKMVLMNLMD
jgi:hypothetical protein